MSKIDLSKVTPWGNFRHNAFLMGNDLQKSRGTLEKKNLHVKRYTQNTG